jgi:RNA polymerase sigma factor (sigma-70 family)
LQQELRPVLRGIPETVTGRYDVEEESWNPDRIRRALDTSAWSSDDPEAQYQVQEDKERIAAAIQRLPERERIVLGLYYYEDLTLKEIGEVLGVTESQVSQLQIKAELRLFGRLEENGPLSISPE